jgi:hypothetical protein
MSVFDTIDNYSVPGETWGEFWSWWREQCRESNDRLALARQAQPIAQRFKEPEPRKKSKRKSRR